MYELKNRCLCMKYDSRRLGLAEVLKIHYQGAQF